MKFLVGVATAATGYMAWHFVYSPLPDVPLENHGAAAVADFMEENKKFWGNETWTFADVPSQLTRLVEYPRDTDGPHYAVSRMTKTFDGVPLLRSTAFLPNVYVREVAPRMIEPALRKKWDKNYRFFEEFATFPAPKMVRQMREGFRVKSRQWCGHVIGSTTLEKVGVQPRSFIYERLVADRADGAVCITYRSLSGTEPDTVKEKENKLSPLGLQALQRLPSMVDRFFSYALRDTFLSGPANNTQEVTMLWQEVLLLPVLRRDIDIKAYEGKRDPNARSLPPPTGVSSTLFALAHEFFKEGSPFTSGLENVMVPPPMAERRGDPRNYEEVGTLMVMTSCNEGKVRPLPKFVERLAMKTLTNNTLEMILRDIADSRKLQKVLPPSKRS
jgi:hypothetical protein